MAKPKTHEEALESLKALKEKAKGAKAELKAFDKKNKVKKGDASSLSEKAAKQREKLVQKIEAADTALVKGQELAKSMKKPKSPRTTKYEYPDDIKDDPKAMKRYRAKLRKEAEGGSESPKKKSKKDKAEKSDKPSKKEKSDKSSKKSKKDKAEKSSKKPEDKATEQAED